MVVVVMVVMVAAQMVGDAKVSFNVGTGREVGILSNCHRLDPLVDSTPP